VTIELDREALLRARMTSLLLAQEPGRDTPAQVVRWFGAMQGQDMGSLVWSLGLRTGRTRDGVAEDFESGAIVRTWPMRGTLHAVPSEDAAWMVRHLGARALDGAAKRRTALGFDEGDADHAVEVLAGALAGQRLMTRSAAVGALTEAGIDTSGQRAYHLLWYVAATGLTCVGPQRGADQTFALLADWAPPGRDLGREEALSTIARRFVRSHGPVSAHDLARWADLTVTSARAALQSVAELVEVGHDGRQLWTTRESLDGGSLPARALPGFDEFVLGYRDRTAQLDAGHERIVVPGGNGVFGNTLVAGGRVVGTWRRRMLTRKVVITAEPFGRLPRGARGQLNHELEGYAAHVRLPAEISWI
jgi:hypothetical protein